MAALACVALWAWPAMGEEPAPEEPAPEEPAPEEPAPEDADSSAVPKKTEVSVLPGAAYDSNLGFGFGVVGDVARFHPDYDPYKARLSAQIFLYLGPRPAGGVRVTYQHHYVKLDLPQLANDRLRLRFTLRYRSQINVGYYGMGNAAPDTRPWETIDRELDPEGWAAARQYNEYSFIKPEFSAESLYRIAGPVSAYGAFRMWWTWVDVVDQSKLAEDLASPDENLTRFLVGAQRHGVVEGTAGLIYDTRDNEIAPNTGMFHELAVRGGPTLEMPGGYGGLHLQARFFGSLLDDWIVVAGRVMADALFGQPPFLELSRYAGQWPDYGPGGAVSIRGVPLQRYHGKIKLIGNFELRTKLLRFNLFKRPLEAGLIAFFDTGRVWADWTPQPTLDGEALGLAVGVGGGLRIQWGGTFMVRADVGWSPDGLGVYFDVNHIF
ncbi:MAG: hypothetical protein KDA24_18040 [Deltaproteobacteria bacterium]|nr:hypothetical protein [Deltaproteobacteria bacterium]